ncbi:Protein kinase, partial [Aphelenchoides avenae]
MGSEEQHSAAAFVRRTAVMVEAGASTTGRAARHQTSNHQPGLASGACAQNKRGSVRGNMSAHHRPHRSRNAIEVVEALNDTDQKALLHSKVGMLVNKRYVSALDRSPLYPFSRTLTLVSVPGSKFSKSSTEAPTDRSTSASITFSCAKSPSNSTRVGTLVASSSVSQPLVGKRNADRTSPSKRNELKDEYDIYTAIRSNYPSEKLEGIPQPYWYGEEFGFRILVLELLGASLHALFTFSDYTLGLETVFEIGKQMIERIRVVHESGYIHCDIKPENFLMGVGGEESVLYLIDFGLSRKYTYIDEDGTLKHIPEEKTGKGYVGTAKYASANSLRCQALSRRDDLESVAYVLAEMIKGEAPFR